MHLRKNASLGIFEIRGTWLTKVHSPPLLWVILVIKKY